MGEGSGDGRVQATHQSQTGYARRDVETGAGQREANKAKGM